VETDFDSLMEEAARRPFVGWDVSYDGRIETVPPWDFDAIVDGAARASPDLLDLGTGGGEWLAARAHLPPRTVATEGWPPNVPVARARLAPLGIDVVAVDGAPDNVELESVASGGGILPFADGAFHLAVSRHESYLPREVWRVLASGGLFLTQQVASGIGDDFYRLLGEAVPSVAVRWTLAFAVRQLRDAGFVVEEAQEAQETMTFADVGALAWYLVNLPFVYPAFSMAAARDVLRRLHEENRRGRRLEVRQPLFWLQASRR
jgi:SAM-dependent methyltransferase